MKRKQPEQLHSVDDPSNPLPSLLTLPQCDFTTNTTKNKPPPSSSHQEPTFMLLQVPPGLTVDDILKCPTSIVGNTANTDGVNSQERPPQACLVLESCGDNNDSNNNNKPGSSYSLSRVETSNAIILVPPFATTQDSKHKKPRKDEDDPLPYVETKARLLNPSCFLELRRKHLDKQKLREILVAESTRASNQKLKHRYHRSKASSSSETEQVGNSGFTAEELALRLQSSNHEIIEALHDLHAFEYTLNDRNESRYTFLVEEIVQETMRSILAVFVEKDGWNFDCIPVEECVSAVMEIMQENDQEEEEEDGFDGWDHEKENIIRHCLGMCSVKTNTEEKKKDMEKQDCVVKLDMAEIALFLAHQLFNSRTSTWPISQFQTEWNRLMPGVGEKFEPSLDLLKGVALRKIKDGGGSSSDNNTEKEVVHLKYFPERKLPMDGAARFRKLFAIKDQWTMEELNPYVKALVVKGGMTLAGILLKFTRLVVDEDGTQLYQSR